MEIMAELAPAPFSDLVSRLFHEPRRQDSLFELKRKKWWTPAADGPDLSVQFCGEVAGNPLGPAAGPHTQMAQNILLSYVAGGRILELKTVQANDRLTIGRPCIDITNVGYNIEWSQELLVEQSLREYAAGAMLIQMFRYAHPDGSPALRTRAGDVIHNISVGYDLAGIQSPKIRRFLDEMRDAGPLIERLRAEIPREFAAARDLQYTTRLSGGVTLSTFHGCPPNEIERICEFLIAEHDFDVYVKMNPPMLGRERLEHLLHDVLGYRELEVSPAAYETAIPLAEGVALCRRLADFAAARKRRFGAKFSNTLEVRNHRDFFPPDNKLMYLSGQPLHVITMTLTDEFRRLIGPAFPISFSAGIDQHNFPAAAACGFAPITVSTDLLRPGGYGRFSGYLDRLTGEMRRVGAKNLDEFALSAFAQAEEARRRSAADSARQVGGPSAGRWAGALNTAIAAHEAREEPRYRADANRKVPVRINSQLTTFDCLTCDKCLPVCPNAANFTYPTPIVAFEFRDIIVTPNAGGGPPTWRDGERRKFAIDKEMQIACYSDFCNECGNCDTFCPEYGGPYIKKPTFYGTLESWEKAAPRDGFVLGESRRQIAGRECAVRWIRGRMKGVSYMLAYEGNQMVIFSDGNIRAEIAPDDHSILDISQLAILVGDKMLDMGAYHTLRHLLAGVSDLSRVNQVNAALLHQ